jgi:hypothetical protein
MRASKFLPKSVSAVMLALGATAATFLFGLAATAAASPGKQIGQVSVSGPNPVAQTSATAKKPVKLKVKVDNNPAGVNVVYKVTCFKSGAVKSKSSNYTTTDTSNVRDIGLTLKKPKSCQLTATVRFSKVPPPPTGGSLVVTLYQTKKKK